MRSNNLPQVLGSKQTDSNKYLSFKVLDDSYAVSIIRIKEILEYTDNEPMIVPMMPPMIVGVINLRGSAVPVVDLSQCLYQKPTTASRRTCVVVMEINANHQQIDVGVVVDAVSEVMMINDTEVEPPPSFADTIKTSFIHGMGKVGDRFVILLDIDQVFSTELQAYLKGMDGSTPLPNSEKITIEST